MLNIGESFNKSIFMSIFVCSPNHIRATNMLKVSAYDIGNFGLALLKHQSKRQVTTKGFTLPSRRRPNSVFSRACKEVSDVY
jgi:hypothetical protein